MSNFYDRITAAASRFRDRPAIDVVTNESPASVSYEDLMSLAAGFAAWLKTTGLEPGDRVAILAGNDARWVAAYLGILRVGAVAVPLDTNYSAQQVATITRDAGAKILLVSARLESVAGEAVPTDSVDTRLARLDMPLDRTPVPPVVVRTVDDAAVILYTSGTTADPKGVVLTHGNLEAERAAALGAVHVTEEDVVLGVLPLFHALAQMANLLLPLSAGARVVFLETVNSTTLLHALRTEGITVLACVPQFFYLIHQRVTNEVAARGPATRAGVRGLIRLSAWLRDRAGINLGPRLFGRVHAAFGPRMRILITGGSRFDPTIGRDLYGMGLVLLNGYGLTETSGAATIVRVGDRFSASVGQALPGVDIRIDPDRTANDDGLVEAGSGEILVRGPIVMREYFGRPDATREVLADGWLRTGDLGRLDAEGRLFITGRKKEVIVLSSGKNLYPEEIEAHYRQSPFIKELCVLGIGTEGEPAAERLHAVVVPDADALRAKGIVNVGELVRFELESLSVRLPAHKRILSYDLSIDALPRTTTGKLKRPEIERWQRQHRSPAGRRPLRDEDRIWTESAGRRALLSAMAARLGRTDIQPDENLELDLRLDSMERVEVLSMLEAQAGTRVAPEARAMIFTVRELVDSVLAASATGEASAASADNERADWGRLLAGAPAEAPVANLKRPTFARALGFFLLLRARWLLAAFVKFRVEGAAAIPTSGPYIITPNHQAYLDGFALAAALPLAVLRQIFFVGAAEYFETPLTRQLARLANIVPVDPDANLVNAMQAAAAGLKLGKVLILFPEGERSIDGSLKPFRKGAAILASHLEVPVLPVAIEGMFELWPRGLPFQWRRLTPWHRPVVTVRFGSPLRIGDAAYAEGIAVVRSAVEGLLQQGR